MVMQEVTKITFHSQGEITLTIPFIHCMYLTIPFITLNILYGPFHEKIALLSYHLSPFPNFHDQLVSVAVLV